MENDDWCDVFILGLISLSIPSNWHLCSTVYMYTKEEGSNGNNQKYTVRIDENEERLVRIHYKNNTHFGSRSVYIALL